MADNLDPEYLRDLEAALQASREAIDDWTTELLSGKKETEGERDTRKQAIALLAAEKKARDELNQLLTKAKNDLKDGVKAFGSALVNTEGGMSKYNASIASTTSGLAGLALTIPVVGTALAGFIKVLGFAVENVTEGNDKLIKAYNDLGEIGATSSFTTSELLDLAETAGYGTRNLQGLITPVKSLGSGLIALGGSTGEGIKKFAELAATTREQRESFRRLGISQEEYTQFQADYIRTTALSGVTISRSVEKQRKAADEYIETLITLAAMTGTDIKKQQQAREQTINQENFAQYLYNRGRERDELRAKSEIAGIDAKRKAELQSAAERIDNEMKSKTVLGQMAYAMLDAASATKILSSIANNGTVVFTGLNSSLLSLGFNIDRINDITKNGGDATEAFMDETAKAVERFRKEQGYMAVGFNEYSIELRKKYGVTNEMLRIANLVAERNTEAGKKAYDQYLKELQDKKNGLTTDPILKAEHARLEAEKNTRSAMDSLYKLLKDFVNPTLTMFYEALTGIVDWIADLNLPGLQIGSNADVARRKKNKEITKLKDETELLQAVVASNPDNTYAQRQLESKQTDLDRLQGTGKYSPQAQRSTLGSGRASAIASQSENANTDTGGSNAVNSARGTDASNTINAPQGSTQALLELIASVESRGGNYNILVGGDTRPLTSMTVAEVLKLQSQMERKGAGFESSAVGKYQIVKSTLLANMGAAGVKFEDKFDENTQEKLGMALLKLRGLDDYLNKKKPPEQFADQLSMEWAALPYHDGLSYHREKGTNKALISREKLMSALPKYGFGGIVDTPQIAMVGDRGREAVVPLPNTDSILSKILTGSSSEVEALTNNRSNSVSNEVVTDIISKLGRIVDALYDANAQREKIYRRS
jgi:hypothetical protein